MYSRLLSGLLLSIIAFSSFSSYATEVEITVSPESIQYRTLPLTIEANLIGGSGSYFYRFEYREVSTKSKWQILQDWTENNQHTFNTDLMLGNYEFSVIARDQSSSLQGNRNASTSIESNIVTYEIREGTSISTVNFPDINLQNCFNQTVSALNWVFIEQVIELDCQNSRIVDLSGIERLSSLKTLNLARNNIVQADSLSGLLNLEVLDLSGNSLSNVGFLLPLNTLTSLDLSGNTQLVFSEVDALIRNNPKLVELGLSDITVGSIFPGYHKPTGEPYGFTQLKLDRTGLEQDLTLLSIYSRLSHVSVAGNHLRNLVGLESLQNLTYLDASDNKLLEILALTSPMMTQLETLNLSGNGELRFADVHQVLVNNPGLKAIGLADIKIGSQFPLLTDMYGNPYALTVLDLSRTGIMDTSMLASYSELKTLRFNGNGIDNLVGLENLTQLNELDLSDNHITYMTYLGIFPQLVDLNLRNNPIINIAGLSELHNLRILDLVNIAYVDYSEFFGITQLNELHLSGKGLSNQDGELLNIAQRNTNLISLSLIDVNLNGQVFNAGIWPMLKKLNVSNANLSDINVLQGLNSLDVSHNVLTGIGALLVLDTLESLNLSGNTELLFSEVDALIRNNPGLVELGLSDIPVGNIFPGYHKPTGEPYGFVQLKLDRTGLEQDLTLLSIYSGLNHLSVAGNHLRNLVGLESLQNLTYLDASDNQLKEILALTSPMMTQLETLNFSGNGELRFADVQQVLVNNPGLKAIGLADIKIGPQFPLLTDMYGNPYALTVLDLSRTGLMDTSTLASYPALKTLWLNGNGIDYTAGLENLVQLNELDLSDNRVMVMNDLSVYPQLVSLNLNNNPIENLSGMSGLQNLRELGLANIGFTNYAELSGFTQLQELYLSGDGIPGHGTELLSFAQQNRDLRSLVLTNIDLNRLFLDATIWPKLEALNVSNTNIISLGVSPGLKSLDVSYNVLTGIGTLLALDTLESLNLSGNTQLSFSEVDALIRNNPGLIELGLSDITVGNIFPGYLKPSGEPYGFTKLSLDRTGLEQDLTSLGMYRELENLSVVGNRLRYLMGIETFQNLTYLDVSDNQLMEVLMLTSPMMTRLETLNLSGNGELRFGDVQQVLVNNPGLKAIGLADIKIGPQFPLLTDMYGNPYALTVLDLSRTGLMDTSTLASYPALKTLRLNGNAIDYPAGLENLGQLNELDLSNNRVIAMNDLSVYPQLVSLNLNNNPIEDLFGLSGLQSLRELGLANTGFTNYAELSGFTQLRELHLSGNGLPGQAFELLNIAQQNPDLTSLSLTKIDLSGQYFDANFWVNLEALDVSDANLQDMNVNPALKILNVSGNQLTSVSSWSSLRKLKSLELSGNSQLLFSEVEGVIVRNPALTELGLSDIAIRRTFPFFEGMFPSYYKPSGEPYGFTTLNLDRTGLVSDLSSLSIYGTLNRLSVSGNQINYLSGVEYLENLNYLDVSNNQLMDVNALLSPLMTRLKALNLSGNGQLSFGMIEQVLMNNPDLIEIGLADIQIGFQFPLLTDFSGNPYALATLDLNRTGITDLTSLSVYNGLEKLYLESNSIQALYGLDSLIQLEFLDLIDNPMIDCMELDFIKTMLNKAEILYPSQCQ